MPKRKTERSGQLANPGGPAAQEAKKRLDAAVAQEKGRPAGGSWLDGRGEPDGTGTMRRTGPDGETVEKPMKIWLGKEKAPAEQAERPPTGAEWAAHKEQINAILEGSGLDGEEEESSASETSTEQGEDTEEEEEVDAAEAWDASMATLQGEFGAEQLAKFSITHAKSETVAKLIQESGHEQRMLRAAEAAFALVACARVSSGLGKSEAYLLEKFNAFGVRGGTQAEFDTIKDAMLDGEPPLPAQVAEWVSKFYFVLEVSEGMSHLFEAPKARYESAMSLCQMANPDRATQALVVANAIVNLAKGGEQVRGVDIANPGKYALDDLTQFVNAGGTEEEYRRVLIMVARMDMPTFDWDLYRAWVDAYATTIRKMIRYRAEDLAMLPHTPINVQTTQRIFVSLLASVDRIATPHQKALVGEALKLIGKIMGSPSVDCRGRGFQLGKVFGEIKDANIDASAWGLMLATALEAMPKTVPAWLSSTLREFLSKLREVNWLHAQMGTIKAQFEREERVSLDVLRRFELEVLGNVLEAVHMAIASPDKGGPRALKEDLRPLLLINFDAITWCSALGASLAALNGTKPAQWIASVLQKFEADLRRWNDDEEPYHWFLPHSLFKLLGDSKVDLDTKVDITEHMTRAIAVGAEKGKQAAGSRTLLTVAQEDRLAKKVASTPQDVHEQHRIAGEVAIAIWANVRKGVDPDADDVDSRPILHEKVADLKAVKGTYKQVFDMANAGFMDGSEVKPSASEVDLWVRWINYCDLGDGQSPHFPRSIADRAVELEGTKYFDYRERRWNVSVAFANAHHDEGSGFIARRWSNCCRVANPFAERTMYVDGAFRPNVPLPYVAEHGENCKLLGRYPSAEMANVTEKRTMHVQFEIMYKLGAYGWLDQQFHPLASFKGVIRAINYATMVDQPDHPTGPDVNTVQYQRKERRLVNCKFAIRDNAPERFDCSAFCEALFKQECQWGFGCKMRGSVSSAFYAVMSETLSTSTVCGERLDEWVDKVRQLACMRNIIATMMADALGEQLDKCTRRNIANEVYGAPPFTEVPVAHQFDDRTAPIMFRAYWMTVHPGGCVKQLWASARRACSVCPRKLFTNTVFVNEVFKWQRLSKTFMSGHNILRGKNDFTNTQHPTMVLNDGSEVAKPQYHQRDLHRALKDAVDFDHWSKWTMHELIAGASALIAYADQARTYAKHFKEDMPGVPAGIADFRINAYKHEAKSNLFVASLLLTRARHWENDEELARLNGCLLYTSPSPRDRSLSRMPSSA